MADLPPIKRPDGSVYRPRKVVAEVLGDQDENIVGVVVFGTHDLARAQVLADRMAERELGRGATAVKPERVWWRDTFQNYRRIWENDETGGRGGVWFAELVEPHWVPASSGPLVTDHV